MAYAKCDAESLRRQLFYRSDVLIRAAHALELAAGQLRQAADHANYLKSSVDIRAAAMIAMHGAFEALELSGEYEFAAWIEADMIEED